MSAAHTDGGAPARAAGTYGSGFPSAQSSPSSPNVRSSTWVSSVSSLWLLLPRDKGHTLGLWGPARDHSPTVRLHPAEPSRAHGCEPLRSGWWLPFSRGSRASRDTEEVLRGALCLLGHTLVYAPHSALCLSSRFA